jgi:hypothetical protein
MRQILFKRGVLITLLALWCVILSAGATLAESRGQSSTIQTSAAKDVDLEIKLYLLVASNAAGESAKLPPQLEAVVRQLRSVLPLTHYRWAATFMNRVNNGSSSNIKGIAGPLLGTTAPTSGTPSFYDLMMNKVSLSTDANGQELVRIVLHFGARLPIMTGGGGPNTVPTINYESTGISTTVNIKENEPVVVGTMSLGATNDMLVLVVSVKRIA